LPRKSPIFHKVKAHSRSNAHVHKYERGHGKKRAEPRKVIARVAPAASPVAFTVDVDGREFKVYSPTFLGALDSGLARSTTTPQHVKITKGLRE